MPHVDNHLPTLQAGSAEWYTVRFSPIAIRERIEHWFAWFALLDETANKAKDPGVARLKLDWWREEVQRMQVQQARHPVAQSLQTYIHDEWKLLQMQRAIDSLEQRILRRRPDSENALLQQCADAYGSRLQLLCNHVAPVLDELGQCLGVCQILQDLPEALAAGHNPLPAETCTQHAIDLDALQHQPVPLALKKHLLSLATGINRARLQSLHKQVSLRPGLRLTAQHLTHAQRKPRTSGSAATGALWAAWRLRN